MSHIMTYEDMHNGYIILSEVVSTIDTYYLGSIYENGRHNVACRQAIDKISDKYRDCEILKYMDTLIMFDGNVITMDIKIILSTEVEFHIKDNMDIKNIVRNRL